MFLETVANLRVHLRQANDFPQSFFFYFELGGITKHFVTGSTGNSGFCFRSTSPPGILRVSGKQNLLFPLGLVIKCLLIYLGVSIYCKLQIVLDILLDRCRGHFIIYARSHSYKVLSAYDTLLITHYSAHHHSEWIT